MADRGLQGIRDADGNLVTGPKAGEFPLEEEQYGGGEQTGEEVRDEFFNDAPESIKETLKNMDQGQIEDLLKYFNDKLVVNA